jgi:DNA-binding transcriptional MerR regulator
MKDSEQHKVEASLKKMGFSFEQVEKLYPKIYETLMPLSITGISPRTYYYWKDKGLIPTVQKKENIEHQREWVRLNLIDFVWLKVIQIMRDFGIPFAKIKESKEMLFSNFLQDIIGIKEDYVSFLRNESSMDDAKINEIIQAIELIENEMSGAPDEFEIYSTVIGMLVMELLIKNDKGSIIISKADNEIEINYFSYKSIADFEKIIMPMLEEPHIQIPIRKIIEEFIDDPNSDKFVDSFELLNLREKKVIDAIRKKDFKEIIIKQDDKPGSFIIELEKDGDILDQKAKEVKRMLGLNEYSEVTIKFRNDKHMYFKNKTRI